MGQTAAVLRDWLDGEFPRNTSHTHPYARRAFGQFSIALSSVSYRYQGGYMTGIPLCRSATVCFRVLRSQTFCFRFQHLSHAWPRASGVVLGELLLVTLLPGLIVSQVVRGENRMLV